MRTIRRNPGYAATVILCLALALGVNTTLFALLDSVYFRRLPVRESDRLLVVQRSTNPFLFWGEYLRVRDRLKTVRTTSTLFFSTEVKAGPQTFGAIAECVSGSFGEVLQAGTAAGEWFRSDTARDAVLSHSFWKNKLNGDPGAIGREILVENHAFRVIGIAPPLSRRISSVLSRSVGSHGRTALSDAQRAARGSRGATLAGRQPRRRGGRVPRD